MTNSLKDAANPAIIHPDLEKLMKMIHTLVPPQKTLKLYILHIHLHSYMELSRSKTTVIFDGDASYQLSPVEA